MEDFYKNVLDIIIFVITIHAIGIPAGIGFFYLIDKIKRKNENDK